MRMRSHTRLVAFVLAFGLVAAACGSDDDTSTGTSSPGGGSDSSATVKVGMALAGPKNDKGFAQAHYDGLVAACEELGCEVNVSESADDSQKQLDALRNLAADNDLVIGVGAEFAAAGTSVAPQFPDVRFSVINGEAGDVENQHIYMINQGYAAYVIGAVAAELSESGTIGYLGGMDIPPTAGSDEGYELGAKSVDDGIEYVSTIVGDFNDSAKAKEAAATQIAEGADVIYAYLDSATEGVIEAIRESGKDVKLFTQGNADCEAPGIVVGGSALSTQSYVGSMVSDFMEETLPSEPKVFALEDPEIQQVQMCDDQPAELQDLADEVTGGINDGKTEIPDSVI
ncbi:MAG: family transporter substrate-binding protein [Acidimicrobiales bacterium]|nr:family transporter substrate-binding protein [Acidimicrobiales bacterium]